MNDANKPPTLDDIDARLKAVNRAKDARKAAEKSSSRAGAQGMGVAVRIGVEIISAVGVGFGMGYFLDRWLDTTPLFMVILLVLGGAAGVMNAYRVVKGLDDTIGLGEAVRRKEELEASRRNGNED